MNSTYRKAASIRGSEQSQNGCCMSTCIHSVKTESLFVWKVIRPRSTRSQDVCLDDPEQRVHELLLILQAQPGRVQLPAELEGADRRDLHGDLWWRARTLGDEHAA